MIGETDKGNAHGITICVILSAVHPTKRAVCQDVKSFQKKRVKWHQKARR